MFQVVWREPTSPRLFAFGVQYDVAADGRLGRRTQTGDVEPAQFTREDVGPFREMPAMFAVASMASVETPSPSDEPSSPGDPSHPEPPVAEPGSDDDQNPAAAAHDRRRRR